MLKCTGGIRDAFGRGFDGLNQVSRIVFIVNLANRLILGQSIASTTCDAV